MSEKDPWATPAYRWPLGVVDPTCPSGHSITESRDRRTLWHIAHELAVTATNETHRRLARGLNAYLSDTCSHHWHDDESGYGGVVPPYRQCLWCNVVEPLDPAPNTAAGGVADVTTGGK